MSSKHKALGWSLVLLRVGNYFNTKSIKSEFIPFGLSSFLRSLLIPLLALQGLLDRSAKEVVRSVETETLCPGLASNQLDQAISDLKVFCLAP